MNGLLTSAAAPRQSPNYRRRHQRQPRPLPEWIQFTALLLCVLQFCGQITRTQTITSRDDRGRILTENSASAGTTQLSETMTYRPDSRLSSYQVSGSLYNETRNYDSSGGYSTRGQLLDEPYLLNNSTSGDLTGQQTAQYLFDQSTIPSLTGGVESGLGVRTLQYINSGNGRTRSRRRTACGQVTQDNYIPQNSVNGTIHYSYDQAGNVTNRAFYLGSSSTGYSQTLTWDAYNRLVGVSLGTSSSTAYTWTTVYDGLGRRVQTNLPKITTDLPVTYYYDPQVEFLELGHNNGGRTWNIYGPDKSSSVSADAGIGGLDAVVVESSSAPTARSTITSAMRWPFPQAVCLKHGARRSAWVATENCPARVASTHSLQTQWRGHYEDWDGVVLSSGSTVVSSFPGFYYMGARYYDPASGRFLSADPLGNASSMSLYDFCNGDPVNGLDPDGRLAAKGASTVENDTYLTGVGGYAVGQDLGSVVGLSQGSGLIIRIMTRPESLVLRMAAYSPLLLPPAGLPMDAYAGGTLTAAGIKLGLTFGAVGAASNIASTAYWEPDSNVNTYVAKGLGGFVGGYATPFGGVVSGATLTGAVSNLTEQALNSGSFNAQSFTYNTAVSGVLGYGVKMSFNLRLITY